jgi:hypothetical protein
MVVMLKEVAAACFHVILVFQHVGIEGVVRDLEGTHLADRCILTKPK